MNAGWTTCNQIVRPQTLYRKGVAELYIDRVLPLDGHIGFTDGAGFRVDLLSEYPRLAASSSSRKFYTG